MSVGRDSSRLFLAQAVQAAAGLVNGILIARALGPASRGVYVLVLTAALTAVALGSLGIDYATTFLLAKRRRGVAELHANALLAAFLLGAAVAGAYALARNPLHAGPLRGVGTGLAWAGVALVPLHFYMTCWRAILSGLGRFDLVSRFEVAAVLAGTALTGVLLFGLHAGVAGLLAGTLASAAGAAAAQAILLHRIEPLRPGFSPSLLIETVRIGVRGHFGNMAFFLLTRVDVFLVNLWLGASAVGCYGLATALAEKAWFLPLALSGAVVPQFGRLDPGGAARLALKSARHSLFLALATVIALVAVVPWAVPLVYGDDFRPAVEPLLLLLPGTIALSVSLALSAHLAYQAGKPQLTAAAGWVAMLLYVPAAFVAIPLAGLRGAALASAAAYLVLGALVLFFFRRETGARLGAIVRFGAGDLRDYAALVRRRPRGERG